MKYSVNMQIFSDDFIKTLASIRANELFTREFFETCTDSWYDDEFFRFKGEVTFNGKLLNPSDDVADKYMEWLQKYKDIYQDTYYTSEMAMMHYNCIINKLREISDDIKEGKKRYKAFECDSEIITKLKSVGNYFVDKYNEELAIYKNTHKDAK